MTETHEEFYNFKWVVIKKIQCAGKDDNQKNCVEIEEGDLHYVPEAEEEQLLSIKIHKTKTNKSKYIWGKKVKMKFFN